MHEWEPGTLGPVVERAHAMAARARAERGERNRRAQLDARNDPPPVVDDDDEPGDAVAAVVIEMDRYQARAR